MAPISTLTVRLSAQIAEFQSEFRAATKSAEQFAGSFEGIATRASAVGTFIGNIATKIATSLASAFGQGIRDAIRVSSEFTNAFIGLGSVARAFGADANAAAQAARQLASDGLLPLKDSATGLKNLLATGFSLDQAVTLMNAFKDSAAFGRQSALSFGDAIRSATEGVKNGNSILVDNAGITKNLSQILKEAGFSAQDLARASSDAGVRMALFNGILKESAAFSGDAARLTQTYSGQVARLDAAYDALLATIGAAITQNASVAKTLGAISDALFSVNTNLVHQKQAFNLVSDGVIFLVRAFSNLVDALDLVQILFHGAQMASNRLFEAFANIGIAIFKFTERAAELQKYLDPINFKRHAAAAKEARDAYVFLEGAAQGFRDASKDARDRTEALSGTFAAVTKRADELARELQATRGQTVQLGESSRPAGRALTQDLGGGAEKAADKAKLLRDALKSVKGEIDGIDDRIKEFGRAFDEHLGEVLKSVADDIKFVEDRVQESIRQMTEDAKRAADFVRDEIKGVEERIQAIEPKTSVWDNFADGVARATKAIADLFGESEGRFARLARDIATVADAFARASKAAQDFRNASNIGDKIAAGAEAAAAFWDATGVESRGAATAGGAATGAQIGGMIVPGWGHLIGGGIGAIAGWIRSGGQGREMVEEFAASMGGFDALQKRLQEMGAEGERLWIALTQGVGSNNPEQAVAAINNIISALDEFGTEAERAQRRLDALGVAVAGVNERAVLFAAPFQKLTEAIKNADGSELESLQQKLMATAQAGQAEFERLGQFAAAAFAGIVNESGDAIGALRQLEPTLLILQQGVNEFGLTSTAAIDQLLGSFALINDETLGPIFSAIQATGQIFAGLSDAGYMTADLFQSVASDIGASFRDLEAQGGDVAKAMALSQPVLQRLWEAQQIYGEITDETTRKLLKQAEEQGLVGAHMRDVNQKILDVLIAIADVFGAKIPDAIRLTSSAGQEAAQKLRRDFKETADGIKAEFANIEPPDINIKVRYDDPGFTPSISSDEVFVGGRVPALAAGGVVRRPTLALVGEAGPEAVVPLSRLGSYTPQIEPETGTVIIELDGLRIAEATVPHIPGVTRRYVGA